jgi:hypothetical protein
VNRKSIARNVWALTLCLLLGGIGLSTFSEQAASAQAVGPSKAVEPGGAVTVEAFKNRLAGNDKKLVGVEALVGRVESSKLITVRDSDELDTSIRAYATDMEQAADTALKEAEKAFQGKGGNANLLADFERTAKAHEARVKQIETRTQKIDTQVKAGTIRLDKPVLQKMSPQERGEFKQYLRPEGVKEMERLHPDLFKGLPSGAIIKPWTFAAVTDGRYAIQGCWGALVETVGNLLVSPAQAAIVAQTASSIANAISKGINDKNQAWADYNNCANNCRWWQFWCKPACLATLIAKLA